MGGEYRAAAAGKLAAAGAHYVADSLADVSPILDDIDAEAVLYEALARGLSFKTMGSVLTLSPPLIIAQADLDRAIDILVESIDAVTEASG